MIKRGNQARVVNGNQYFPTGMIVFIRSVTEDSAYVQDPFDSHERMTFALRDLEEVVR